jgi:hypothetical protein
MRKKFVSFPMEIVMYCTVFNEKAGPPGSQKWHKKIIPDHTRSKVPNPTGSGSTTLQCSLMPNTKFTLFTNTAILQSTAAKNQVKTNRYGYLVTLNRRLYKSSVADLEPHWIRIQWGSWIRIRNPDPDPGGQKKNHTKIEKLVNFIFLSSGSSLSRAEGFSCS